MAIQPIDLQTLFTQMDKVAKSQNAQREGLAVQQAIQGAQLQKKTEQQIRAVNEAQNTGDDGAEKVKDKPQNNGGQGKSGGNKKKEQEKAEKEETKASIIDPRLGRNIDISL
jgi:hypothetical protein